MSEIRFNPIDNKYVIISQERSRRPSDYFSEKKHDRGTSPDSCPFCEGNEGLTPPEVFSLRDNDSVPDQRGWKVRVVPNKYGVLEKSKKYVPLNEGLISRTEGSGFHEVVVESTDHSRSLGELTAEQIYCVFITYQKRLENFSCLLDEGYVSVFKNHKYEAGASLSHPHSQIIATPFIPSVVMKRLENLKNYYISRNSCMVCDIIETEIKEKSRIVYQNEGFILLAPYWSAMPFEVTVIPRYHSSDFLEIKRTDLIGMAEILKSYLMSILSLIGDIPYNIMLSLMPVSNRKLKEHYKLRNSFHWQLTVFPRVNRIAGFELQTGTYINTTAPEDAADVLKYEIKSIINK